MPTHAKLSLAKSSLDAARTEGLLPSPSRRGFVATASALGALALAPRLAHAANVRTDISSLPPYGNGTLPAGIRFPAGFVLERSQAITGVLLSQSVGFPSRAS